MKASQKGAKLYILPEETKWTRKGRHTTKNRGGHSQVKHLTN